MMKLFNEIQYKKVIVAGIAGVALLSAAIACKPKFYEEPAPGAPGVGSIDFTTYVAVGSNITAGWMDGDLNTEGQSLAYPKLIADKIRAAKSDVVFSQPDINSVNGWAGTGKGKLYFPVPACNTVSYTAINTAGDNTLNSLTGNPLLVTNLAVPFQVVSELNSTTVAGATNTYNTALPYFERQFGTTTLGTSHEAVLRNPTFFTVWYGYQDVLKYATSGGTSAFVADAVFQANIEKLLDSLLVNPNAKGVIALIPYVDLFPVVTNSNRRLTSSSDPARLPIRFDDQAHADLYNGQNGIPAGLFSGAAANKNYLAITTKTGTVRQMSTSKDFIVRGNVLDSSGSGIAPNGIGQRDPLSVRNCTPNTQTREGRGLSSPIPNSAVLDKDEIVDLRAKIDVYNQIIRDAVAARNTGGTRIGIVDLNAFYTKLTDPLYGIQYGSLIVRANHPSLGPDYGGFYSLDRTYPNPRGQSLIANEFIKTINATFGASLSLYDPSTFRVNELP